MIRQEATRRFIFPVVSVCVERKGRTILAVLAIVKVCMTVVVVVLALEALLTRHGRAAELSCKEPIETTDRVFVSGITGVAAAAAAAPAAYACDACGVVGRVCLRQRRSPFGVSAERPRPRPRPRPCPRPRTEFVVRTCGACVFGRA